MAPMLYARTAEAIVRHWRDCVRDLEIVGAKSAEGRRLKLEIDRLRGEYHRLSVEAVRDHEPALPPFPSTVEN